MCINYYPLSSNKCNQNSSELSPNSHFIYGKSTNQPKCRFVEFLTQIHSLNRPKKVLLWKFVKYGYRVCSSTDRAPDFGSGGWGFESLQAHQRITQVKFLAIYLHRWLQSDFQLCQLPNHECVDQHQLIVYP